MPNLPPLRDVIKEHGLGTRKHLGQHFLLDANLTAKIARGAGNLKGVEAIEIGPGPGGLTRALLESNAKRITVIEKDSRCIGVMERLSDAYPGRLNIVEGDATAIDPANLTDTPRKIIANLPYNVSTALLTGWLENASAYQGFTLMFQKEVADRLVASPGAKTYGRLSVLCQWLCETKPLFNVAREAFTPPPKVISTVVGLVPRPAPLAAARPENLEQVTAAAFGQRRKMLRQSLKSLGIRAEDAGLDPTARAESLTPEDFCALARLLED